jgi:hypothetical protein
MPPRYTVHSKDLNKGIKIEQHEHPTRSPRVWKNNARDHLQLYGPGYYRAEPVAERIVQNINHRMRARPIRRKKAPRPFNPLIDSPFY